MEEDVFMRRYEFLYAKNGMRNYYGVAQVYSGEFYLRTEIIERFYHNLPGMTYQYSREGLDIYITWFAYRDEAIKYAETHSPKLSRPANLLGGTRLPSTMDMYGYDIIFRYSGKTSIEKEEKEEKEETRDNRKNMQEIKPDKKSKVKVKSKSKRKKVSNGKSNTRGVGKLFKVCNFPANAPVKASCLKIFNGRNMYPFNINFDNTTCKVVRNFKAVIKPLNDKSLGTRDIVITVDYEPYSKFKPYSCYCYKGLFIDRDTSQCCVFINQVVYEDGEVWKSDIKDSK